MEYNLPKILNKSEIAKAIGMPVRRFHMKLNGVNYNKFNEEEQKIINAEVQKQIEKMGDPFRDAILEFCYNLGLPALELLKMGYFEYVVDSYLNETDMHNGSV